MLFLKPTRLLLTILSFSIMVVGCKKDEPQPQEPDEPDEVIITPIATFEYSDDGNTVQFTFTGSDAHTYEWSFGDGETSDEMSPEHEYAQFGTYAVELTVRNGDSSDVATVDVEVQNEPIIAFEQLDLNQYDGAFYAINYQREWVILGEEKTVKTGAALAWCKTGSSYDDVGQVTVQQNSYGDALTQNADGIYEWIEDPDEQIGFNRNSGPLWSTEGGWGHPSFNGLSNPWPFPQIGDITWADGGGVVQVLVFSADADTLLYTLKGPNGTVIKGAQSPDGVSFNSDDFQQVGSGTLEVIASGYTFFEQVLGAKTYVAVNVTSSQLVIEEE